MEPTTILVSAGLFALGVMIGHIIGEKRDDNTRKDLERAYEQGRKREYNKRMDEAVTYECEIDRLNAKIQTLTADIDEYRREYRTSVKERLAAYE